MTLVNLRRARKAKARAEAAKHAEENRLRFGRSNAERSFDEATQALERQRLDAHRRDKNDELTDSTDGD